MWIAVGNTIMRCGGVVTPALPTGLTLTLISGGVKIDFTDNSGGTAEHEIWAQSDGGASALLTTLAAADVSYDDTVSPVDLRYYKVRAKVGTNYSAFTSEVSIAMLGVEKIGATWNAAGGAWWNGGFDAGWSGDGSKLSCNGSAAFVTRYTFWTVGKTYRIITSAVRTSGSLLPPYNGTTVSQPNIVTTTTTNVLYITAATYMCIYSPNFVGDITALSIKEVLVP